jgi:hypothetical protein
VSLPHVGRRTAAGQTLEELRFERIVLNARLDDSSFRVQ